MFKPRGPSREWRPTPRHLAWRSAADTPAPPAAQLPLFRIRVSGFRSEFRVQETAPGFAFRTSDPGFGYRVQDFGSGFEIRFQIRVSGTSDPPQTRQRPPPHHCPCFRDPSFGYRRSAFGSGFRVQASGFLPRVSGTGFGVSNQVFGFRIRVLNTGDLPQTRQRPPPHNRSWIQVSGFGFRMRVSNFRSGFRVRAICCRNASAPRRTTAPAIGFRVSDPVFGHRLPSFGSRFRVSYPGFGYRRSAAGTPAPPAEPLPLLSRFEFRVQASGFWIRISGTGFRLSNQGFWYRLPDFGSGFFESGFQVKAIYRRHASTPRRTTAPGFAFRVSGPGFGCRLPTF